MTSWRTSAALFTVFDPDGSLPHEAFVELAGSPAVSVRLFPEGDARTTVDGVEFHDVPRDSVPAFLRSVHSGLARTKGRLFPPGRWLVVPLPGDETYREPIVASHLTRPGWPAWAMRRSDTAWTQRRCDARVFEMKPPGRYLFWFGVLLGW